MARRSDRLPGLSRRQVPLVLQHERAECGLACLAMVAGYFGKSISLEQLRGHCRFSGHGVTFEELIEAAARLQLAARPLRLTLPEVSRLQLPAVLHWRMNHFVVLTRSGRGRMTIHDPATGKRTVGRAEMDESFTGIALEFTPVARFTRRSEKRGMTFLDFVGTVRHIHRYLGVMLFLLFATQLLALVPAIATQILIDEVVLGQDRLWLYRALGGLAIVMLLTVMLDTMRSWIGLYTGTRLAADGTVSVLHHLLSLPVSFIKQRHLGDLMSKLESLTPIRQAMTDHVVNALVQFIVLVTTLAIMMFYSPWLTAVSMAGLLATAILLLSVLPSTRRLNERTLIHRAAQNSSLLETLRAYETMRNLGLCSARRLHWQSHFLRAAATQVQQGKLAILRTAGTGLINTAEQVLFLAVGISGILQTEISLGVLFAFMSLRGRVSSAALGLTDAIQRFSLLKVHTGRVSDIVLARPLEESPPGALTATVAGSLEARGLSFCYQAGSSLIEDVSFCIAAGSHAVITGPSGCGKTTLLKLLAGNLQPGSGELLVDGIEMALWHRDTLCQQCGTVMQDDHLFQGTVTENISAFAPAPDLARVRAAAVAAEVWADIQQLPMRTETLIGDTATGLSGGQLQRLTLARALYRRPRMLFLDEATSHLDVDTEKRVLHNIARLDITVVSVAHRPDAIALANQVIVLDGR